MVFGVEILGKSIVWPKITSIDKYYLAHIVQNNIKARVGFSQGSPDGSPAPRLLPDRGVSWSPAQDSLVVPLCQPVQAAVSSFLAGSKTVGFSGGGGYGWMIMMRKMKMILVRFKDNLPVAEPEEIEELEDHCWYVS